ncbi:antibiotic biosynthesis monooxygenase [Altericroceibacterium spongiae]|uniref:Antibiotic biosynthesis monooxygenase n=1 Tax=Altericroceibacterium spongiae TaxID=2320269 RepID=A0A420EFB4_9SPHN|nr:antibiotic biosynthesis monooxygenase [Altericroceibacterium spongiae]RKF19368.1 antibiotic biosynthesis monooxygenase [Altericroceibacterium spongiae]
MIAVIFEVRPATGRSDDYLAIAAKMLPLAEKVEGFLSVERFQSLSDPGKILSLSFFEDESAVQRWRMLHAHRAAQSRGRAEIFEDYRLRIAQVARDYGKFDRAQAPGDSRAVHDP